MTSYIGITNRKIPVADDISVGSKVAGPFGTLFSVIEVEELPDSRFKSQWFENLKLTMLRESSWPNKTAEDWWEKDQAKGKQSMRLVEV